MRFIIVLIASMFALTSLFAQADPDKVYERADEMPRFGDCKQSVAAEASACSDKAILDFIARNVKYPALARKSGIQGLVIVQFAVNKDGSTSGHKVIKDIGGGCGAEAVRVVQMMRSWSVGKQNGQSVSTYMNIPFRFKLEEDIESEAKHTLYVGTYTLDQISKTDLQKALQLTPTVRDATGNSLKVQSLRFVVEGKRKSMVADVKGDTPNSTMLKLAKRAKLGSSVILEADITQDGKKHTVQRFWTVK